MKKIYLFAAAAAMLTACSSEELANQEVAQQEAETPVAFSIYTPRSVTRAGEAGTLTTNIVGDASKSGFGVFAYYSNGKKYAEANTYANFMYNQQVKGNGDGTAAPTKWSYEPVKYWPNEFGKAATSDDIDRVSFFAYAPWTEVDPSTGVMANAKEDEKNITAMIKNTTIGDPIIKYVVDTDPLTSVDLLWGVAGADYNTAWPNATTPTATAEVKTGNPFIDLLKPNDPVGTSGTYNDGKIKFNLRHALAKLNVQIDYIDDANTPAPEAGNTGDFDAGEAAEGTIEADPVETKVFIREIKIGGFSMKGALNLNNYAATPKFYTANGKNENTAQPIPNWKAYDGENDLVYEPVIFKDGRRDGKEGASDAVAESESFLGLNPCLLQTAPYEVDNADYPTKFTNTNLKGVLKTPANLFANWTEADGYKVNTDKEGCIFVIPNNKPIDIEIVYDVETVNPKLASKLSDGITPGLSVENKIRKTSTEIFNLAQAVTMQAGEFYTIKIHLGMTSVKVEAEVTAWTDLDEGTAELPYNQPQP